MKSIYGLPAADGCIYCNCCGEYLCPEDSSLSDGFSDDKPILLREVMREEAEAAALSLFGNIRHDQISDFGRRFFKLRAAFAGRL